MSASECRRLLLPPQLVLVTLPKGRQPSMMLISSVLRQSGHRS
ncbi:hypothetical protein PI125_g11761 [Phytophthora idaei]|nr:hypothetical protein PI125_g11761 [Phytophthora idaei]